MDKIFLSGLTVEAWVYPRDWNGANPLVTKGAHQFALDQPLMVEIVCSANVTSSSGRQEGSGWGSGPGTGSPTVAKAATARAAELEREAEARREQEEAQRRKKEKEEYAQYLEESTDAVTFGDLLQQQLDQSRPEDESEE